MLARFLARLAQQRYSLSGFADHLVSEALYLNDPDGNGLELYRDRPREQWQWQGTQIQMDSLHLDVRQLLTEGQTSLAERSWDGLEDGTHIGHMHLRVGHIQQAAQFYHHVLGFDIVSQLPGALFVSAGGYHHHIGLNTWQSQGAPQAPIESVGLRFFTIALPNEEAVQNVQNRIEATGIAVERQDQGFVVHDPWNNKIHIVVEK